MSAMPYIYRALRGLVFYDGIGGSGSPASTPGATMNDRKKSNRDALSTQ